MRPVPLALLLALATLAACGGGDSNEPEDPFPDAAGVYEIGGGFDGIPAASGSFEGTLELTQASRSSGALQGSAAVLATIGGEVFNLSDPSLSNANVSPGGVISFTMADGSGSWTFSGTLSGSSIGQGRHTLASGGESISGDWQGSRVAGSGVAATAASAVRPLSSLLVRLLVSAPPAR